MNTENPDLATQARHWHARGQPQRAEPLYLQALAQTPGDWRLEHDYAVLLMQTGHVAAALEREERIVALQPEALDSQLVLALCARVERQPLRCLQAAQAALRLAPHDGLAWMLSGHASLLLGDLKAGEQGLRQAVQLNGGLAEAWHLLGDLLFHQERWREAAEAYGRAMAVEPTEVYNVGLCAEHLGELTVARDAYARMHALRPDRADCLARLAQAEAKCCRFDAEQIATRVLNERLAAARPANDLVDPFHLTFLAVPEALRLAELGRQARAVQARAPAAAPAAQHSAPPARLRIGYLGADFGHHAVGRLIAPLFAAHDRTVCEVFVYTLKPMDEAALATLQAGADQVRDLSRLGAEQALAPLCADRLDLLLDLGGYTHGARPELLAARPARRQFGWLGYLDGMQAPWLDGILLDSYLVPEGAPWPYADPLIRLGTYCLPGGEHPLPGDRQAARETHFGVRGNETVLLSLNNSYKLDAELVDAWTQIARRAPQALFAVYLPPYARAGFSAAWIERGGDPARLRLLDNLRYAENITRAAAADLMLDAFRYQAGATAMAAVWAGLPILSRAGDRPVQNTGAGLNRFLGLEELVASDVADYVSRAASLALDPARLATLRQAVGDAARRRRLFDPRRIAEAIEQLAR